MKLIEIRLIKVVKSRAGSRYVRNLTLTLRTNLTPDLLVSQDLVLVQIEVVRCQKGQNSNVTSVNDQTNLNLQ